MSNNNNSNNKGSTPATREKQQSQPYVAVGVDVGSLFARIAIGSSSSVDVVANALGERATLALCTFEEEGSNHSLVGEAAQKALFLKKQKDMCSNSIRCLIQSEEDNTDEKKCSYEASTTTIITAFFLHIIRMICDASSAKSPLQLKFVLSVPIAQPFTKEQIAHYISCIQQSVTDKQKQSSKVNTNIVIGVITEPMAVCIAHGLLNGEGTVLPHHHHRLTLTRSGSSSLSAQDTNTTTTNTTNQPPSSWKTCVVFDFGASGVTLTKVVNHSNLGSIASYVQDSTLSGKHLTDLVVQHAVTQFERKHRVANVLENYKASQKLQQACTHAIKTLARTSTITITIDGLYEGIDCLLPLSRPRLDMIASPMMRRVEEMLLAFVANDDVVDILLLCGGVCEMPMVKEMMERLFPNAWKGKPSVAVEEAVAIGCATFAQDILVRMDLEYDLYQSLEQSVVLSPLGIGVAWIHKEEEELSSAVVPLIEIGMPLPASVFKMIDFDNDSNKEDEEEACHYLAIVELSKEEGESSTHVSRVVAKIPIVVAETAPVGLIMELSEHGTLSISVNGNEPVTL